MKYSASSFRDYCSIQIIVIICRQVIKSSDLLEAYYSARCLHYHCINLQTDNTTYLCIILIITIIAHQLTLELFIDSFAYKYLIYKLIIE